MWGLTLAIFFGYFLYYLSGVSNLFVCFLGHKISNFIFIEKRSKWQIDCQAKTFINYFVLLLESWIEGTGSFCGILFELWFKRIYYNIIQFRLVLTLKKYQRSLQALVLIDQGFAKFHFNFKTSKILPLEKFSGSPSFNFDEFSPSLVFKHCHQSQNYFHSNALHVKP